MGGSRGVTEGPDLPHTHTRARTHIPENTSAIYRFPSE